MKIILVITFFEISLNGPYLITQHIIVPKCVFLPECLFLQYLLCFHVNILVVFMMASKLIPSWKTAWIPRRKGQAVSNSLLRLFFSKGVRMMKPKPAVFWTMGCSRNLWHVYILCILCFCILFYGLEIHVDTELRVQPDYKGPSDSIMHL